MVSDGNDNHVRISGDVKDIARLVGIPLAIAVVLGTIVLARVGGSDTLRYVFGSLLTWKGALKALGLVIGLIAVAWARHFTTYRYAAPPMWFRPTLRENLVELLVFLAVILAGVWAFRRFLPPPLP